MERSTKQILYLAGGFKSGWQLKAHELLPSFEMLDPSKHNIKVPKAYIEWDLEAISMCSIVLAYMEPTNPGGYGLALEIGYAKALGKNIIFVDEIEDIKIKHYFEMVRQVSDLVFPSLQAAIEYLNNIS